MKFADVRKYVTGLLSASFVNKSILDNLAEDENENLTYKGAAIEGGGGGITELPIATTETLGGVIVGDGLSVDETGVLSALGGGSSGDTYLNMSTTTLWEGEMSQVGDTGVCSESIENFDYLITYGMPGDVQTERHLAWLKVDDIKNNYGENNFSYKYYESAYTRCSFTDDLNFKCTQSSASGSVHFIYTKIEGVKISGNAGTSGGSNTEIKSYNYTGTGSFGEGNPTILEFESKPEWVLVYGTATSTNNMTKSFFTVDSPVFYTEVYNNGASQGGTGSGLLKWSEDYKSVNMMLKAGSDAHTQFNYPDTEYTVTYATLGSGGGSLTELPIATEDTLGGIIVGEGLDIDENGILSVINGGSTGGSDIGCNLKTFTYTGTGSYGSSNPTVLEFEEKPTILFIQGLADGDNDIETQIIQGQNKYCYTYYNNTTTDKGFGAGTCIWENDGRTLKIWTNVDGGAQFNTEGSVYSVIYFIEDSGGNSSSTELPDNIVLYAEDEEVIELPSANSNKMNYSLEEQVIGTWLDGKPLYQKTVYIESLPNSSVINYNTNIKDVNFITFINGISSNGTPLNCYIPTDPTWSIGLYSALTENEIIITIEVASDRSNLSAYITVQYTKTTD